MLTIHLTRRFDSSVALRLTCPEASIFQHSIGALKFEIPVQFRTYDPFSKCWIILSEAALELEKYIQRMVAKFCAEVVVDEEEESAREEYQERRKRKSSTKQDDEQQQSPFDRRRQMTFQHACATLFVTPGAPFEVIQGAYRALAKLHHPDLGGDDKMMRLVNTAYEVITENLKNRAASAA